MTRFAGKSVIITGSSSGIGRATAVLFAKNGAQVTITGRNAEKLEATKKKLLKVVKTPENVNVVVANLTDAKGQDQIIQSAVKKFGKIDILINNAGANVVDGTVNTDQSIDLYHKTFQINFQAVVEMVKKTKKYLIESKGEIVNVSSIAAGPQAVSMSPYYAAAKAALNQYTRCVALDLIKQGVRVNSVSPGIIATDFMGAMGVPEQAQKKIVSLFASEKGCIPAGVPGKPEDIAELIVFLSDRKRSFYIVGQSIVADGGTSLISPMESQNLEDVMELGS